MYTEKNTFCPQLPLHLAVSGCRGVFQGSCHVVCPGYYTQKYPFVDANQKVLHGVTSRKTHFPLSTPPELDVAGCG